MDWKKGPLKTYLPLLSYLTLFCLPALPGDYYNDRSFSGGSHGPTETQTPRKGKVIILQWSPLLYFLLLRVYALTLYFKQLYFY